MPKVIVELPSSILVVDAERVPTLIQSVLGAEVYGSKYKNREYMHTIKPMETNIEIRQLSDEHYKIYKIAGEEE